MTAAGAILGDDGRLRFPRALVEDMVDKAAKSFPLYGRDPRHHLDLSGDRVHYGTAGAAVNVVDLEERIPPLDRARPLRRRAARPSPRQHPFLPAHHGLLRDRTSWRWTSTRSTPACPGTTKHVGTSFSDPAAVDPCMELIHMVAGGEEAWRAMPFVSLSNCFVVPPMKFATESCLTMEACIRAGMPILLLSAGQAGATAPAPIASAIVQAVAECLAGVVYVNAMAPGHPAVFGTWPFVSDLRTGCHVGRLGGTGASFGGLRPDAQVLRHPRRRGGRHERQQGARHAGRVGTGDHQRALRVCRGST
jgi:trimethylamine--corrinoid protein Co-methyltransferase